MLSAYILLSYIIGYFMLIDALKLTRQLIVMDIVMFLLSPASVINFVFVKIVSHFFDLEKVVFIQENEK